MGILPGHFEIVRQAEGLAQAGRPRAPDFFPGDDLDGGRRLQQRLRMTGDGGNLNAHQFLETHLLQHIGGPGIGSSVGCRQQGGQQ